MKKVRDYEITETLLDEYQVKSFENASELLVEATTLLEKEHYARAYFIACAAIEETGKAYLAFSSKGRNLDSPSVQHAIKLQFEDHKTKIVTSLLCVLYQTEMTEDKIEYFMELTGHLHRGREKSMYVDITAEGEVKMPRDLVRPKASLDCISLAQRSLEATLKYTSENSPGKSSSYHDKLLCMSSTKTQKIMCDRNFWEYFLDILKKESKDIAYVKAIVKYHDEYYCKGRKFNSS